MFRSSERQKLVIVQLITFDSLNDALKHLCQDDVLATYEVADYLQAYGSVVLVVGTAG